METYTISQGQVLGEETGLDSLMEQPEKVRQPRENISRSKSLTLMNAPKTVNEQKKEQIRQHGKEW